MTINWKQWRSNGILCLVSFEVKDAGWWREKRNLLTCQNVGNITMARYRASSWIIPAEFSAVLGPRFFRVWCQPLCSEVVLRPLLDTVISQLTRAATIKNRNLPISLNWHSLHLTQWNRLQTQRNSSTLANAILILRKWYASHLCNHIWWACWARSLYQPVLSLPLLRYSFILLFSVCLTINIYIALVSRNTRIVAGGRSFASSGRKKVWWSH